MSSISRRCFVGKSVLTLGAAAWGGPALLRAGSPNNRVEIALLGAGGRGRAIIRQMAALPDVHVKYICDVEDAHGSAAVAEVAKIQGSQPKQVLDLRQVLDDPAVHGLVIATPEQWHAPASIWACQAGKDVYVEKNITLSIWEGRQMIEAVKKYRRVLQVGTQNRSWSPAYSARDYIKSGQLGKVLYVKVYGMLPDIVGGYQEKKEPDTAVPPGLDWDRWLGPARLRPYNRHLHRKWYGYWDFSGGNTSDALHTLDLARILLDDPPHPTLVECMGGRYQMDDGGDMPDVQIVAFQYDKLVMSFFNTGFTPYYQKAGPEIRMGDKFPYWPQNADRIEVFGTRRLMYVGRHGAGWQVFEKDGKLVAQDKAPHADQVHLPNFIDCIRSRKEPNGNVRQGHRSACLEHLANIAYRTGNQRLVFDPKTETFVGSEAANRFLKPHYRDPYRIPDQV